MTTDAEKVKATSHMVLKGQDVLCLNCGAKEKVMPNDINVVLKLTTVFEKRHAKCEALDGE